MGKVSFDFDGTLSRKDVQKFAKELVEEGHEVWIVTSRFSNEAVAEKGWYWIREQNAKLFEVADECGINRENIHFTNQNPKVIFLKDKDFLFHLDDDIFELMDIMDSKDKCKPLNVDHMSWDLNCREIVDEKL